MNRRQLTRRQRELLVLGIVIGLTLAILLALTDIDNAGRPLWLRLNGGN